MEKTADVLLRHTIGELVMTKCILEARIAELEKRLQEKDSVPVEG